MPRNNALPKCEASGALHWTCAVHETRQNPTDDARLSSQINTTIHYLNDGANGIYYGHCSCRNFTKLRAPPVRTGTLDGSLHLSGERGHGKGGLRILALWLIDCKSIDLAPGWSGGTTLITGENRSFNVNFANIK